MTVKIQLLGRYNLVSCPRQPFPFEGRSKFTCNL